MEPWGYQLSIDLQQCNAQKIRNEENIKEFVKELCDNVIFMTRYGDPWLKRFGVDPGVTGFTLFQPIEESQVSAHFIENVNAICLDIFSCKSYPIEETVKFCVDFFEAQESNFFFIERMILPTNSEEC